MRKGLFYISVVLFALASCAKEETLQEKGEVVRLVPVLPGEAQETKVSVVNWSPTGYDTYHLMKWESNDRISIQYNQRPGEVFDYEYYSGKWNADYDELHWTTNPGSHDFFGIYPQTGNISISGIDTGVTPSQATVTATLPEIENLAPGYSVNFPEYCFMTAAKHVNAPGGSLVIPFSMFCTVVRIAFRNYLGMYSDIIIENFELEADLPVTGTYSGIIEADQPPQFIVTDNTAPGDISSPSDSYSFSITHDETWTRAVFMGDTSTGKDNAVYKTFFVLPQNYSSFTVNVETDYGSFQRIFTPYESSFFEPCRLHTLNIDFRW